MEQLWPVDGVSVPEMLGGEPMTDDKGAGEPFAKAIRKGVLIAQDLEPGMSIMVGGYVFTGKYTTWADQINRALDEMVKAERERCAKIIAEYDHERGMIDRDSVLEKIRGGQDGK